MCLAIFKPSNKKVLKHEMETAFDNNDDGAGFAYPHKGKVIIEKGFMTFDAFWDAIEPHMDKPMAIHFRWSTHGLVDESNCHPFAITDSLAMIHNGVISGVEITDKDKSDTRTFVDDYVKPIHKGNSKFIYSDYGNRTLQACIGSGSKLVFINKKGNHVIVNEQAGEWQDGIWYSNKSHQEIKVRYSNFSYSPYGSCSYTPKATSNDVLGKRKKVKSKKNNWLPKSERKVEQARLRQTQLELTNSIQDTLQDDITPKQPSSALRPVEDCVDDTIGTFLPLL